MLEQAERLHRQFFCIGAPRGTRPAWEPPANVFEDREGFLIMVALPGVPLEQVEVVVDTAGLVVRASSQLPFPPRARDIHRLEIPYGYFERRIQLPASTYELVQRELRNGCLVLNLRKVIRIHE